LTGFNDNLQKIVNRNYSGRHQNLLYYSPYDLHYLRIAGDKLVLLNQLPVPRRSKAGHLLELTGEVGNAAVI
jgi:hypothetical protein